ncbi:MAG TPA: hypothetical protein VEX41_04375, partial [Candidatus Eisenbacteria bacterium]|nr:hypothetical protein [Candidatus Eisenbacteria bacterium]
MGLTYYPGFVNGARRKIRRTYLQSADSSPSPSVYPVHLSRPRRHKPSRAREAFVMRAHAVVRCTAALQVFLLMATLVLPALASAAVWTDQADYSPGSVVTISGDNSDGAGYLAGETVDVVVSGPNGYASSCSATADEAGAWSCQVTLWDTELAVGAYTYTATGQTSGVSQSGTFTDAVQVTITSATFVWKTTTSFSVALEGTYTCTGTSGGNACNDADDVTVEIRASDGSNPAAGGALAASRVLTQTNVGADRPWSTTFAFDSPAPGGGFTTPADGQFDITAVFHGKLGTSARTSSTAIRNDYFGIDRVNPESTIAAVNPANTCNPGPVPCVTANGTATDPGSATPVPHFSGLKDIGTPLRIQIVTDPGGVLVDGTEQFLDLTSLGNPKQTGNWAYQYLGTLEPDDYCLTSRTTDAAGNVQSLVTSSCFNIAAANAVPNSGTISGPSPVDEGSSHDYISDASDPDLDPLSYVWSVVSGNATIAGGQGTDTVSLDFGDGPSTVVLHLVVDDGFGPVSPTDLSITVANVAPTTSNLAGDATAGESSTTIHTYTYDLADPGVDNLTAYPDCGIGGVLGTNSNTNTGGSFDCTFPDGPASPSVSVYAEDDDAPGNGNPGNTES